MARTNEKTDLRSVMTELETLGTEQAVKIYRRHGATGPMFGVSFANLGKLKKRIQVDHDLARELWATENVDARTLALMIADPEQLRIGEAERWLRAIDYYMLSNVLGGLVARAAFAEKAFEKWTRSRKEYVRHCGWDVFCTLLKNGHVFPRERLQEALETLEAEIHGSPNRARNVMNMAVIAIGVYGEGMKGAAIRTAKRIGPVEVDHGDTSCKTAEAVPYIEKGYAHRMKKKAARPTKKAARPTKKARPKAKAPGRARARG